MSKSASEKKALRQIAHHLDAVVMVGDQGLSSGVMAEVERALTDHELIKIKLAIGDREARTETANAIADACNAEVVQNIGKIVVLFRANPKANPKLSNIARYAS